MLSVWAFRLHRIDLKALVHFLHQQARLDHHTHFLIGAPPFWQGVEHFTFHFRCPTEVMQNVSQFVKRANKPFGERVAILWIELVLVFQPAHCCNVILKWIADMAFA